MMNNLMVLYNSTIKFYFLVNYKIFNLIQPGQVEDYHSKILMDASLKGAYGGHDVELI